MYSNNSYAHKQQPLENSVALPSMACSFDVSIGWQPTISYHGNRLNCYQLVKYNPYGLLIYLLGWQPQHSLPWQQSFLLLIAPSWSSTTHCGSHISVLQVLRSTKGRFTLAISFLTIHLQGPVTEFVVVQKLLAKYPPFQGPPLPSPPSLNPRSQEERTQSGNTRLANPPSMQLLKITCS